MWAAMKKKLRLLSPGPHAPSRLRPWLNKKARRLVMAHRPAIVGLAGALLDRALAAGGPWEAFAISIGGDELIALLGGNETALLLRRAV